MHWWSVAFALSCGFVIVFSWPLEDDSKTENAMLFDVDDEYTYGKFKKQKFNNKTEREKVKRGEIDKRGKKDKKGKDDKKDKKGKKVKESKDKKVKKYYKEYEYKELFDLKILVPDKCVFPFEYNGEVFHECTDYDYEGKLWCSEDYEYNDHWQKCEVLKSEEWIKDYERRKKEYGKEFFETKRDNKEDHYPKHLQEKVRAGTKVKQYEEDEFENEFGRYKERNGTSVVDIISSVNKANDATFLEEGDLAPIAPNFDYVTYGKALMQTNRVVIEADIKCVFPFTYEGVVYYKCTEVDSDYLWCSTKYNANKKQEKKCKVTVTDVKDEKREVQNELQKPLKDTTDGWGRRKRDARRDRVYLWLDRVVPYKIDAALAGSADVIKSAMQELSDATCVKFRELSVTDTLPENWILFVKKTGCWSSVGRTFWTSGYQEISLGTNCVYKGIIIHEIMHALGFWHEQSRPDRDDYVEIFWENIVESELHNFNKYGHGVADTLQNPYDTSSIMHYGQYSFAKDAEKPTIRELKNEGAILGQRNSLSPIDIAQINLIYDCTTTGTGWSNWSDYGPCDDGCQKERSRFCMDPNDRTACKSPLSQDYIYWGIDAQKAVCPDEECFAPVNGHWNKWGSWEDCSVTCDFGIQTRTRECTDPAPKNGGANCIGSNTSQQACQKKSCSSGPFDCTFDVESDPLCSWSNVNSPDDNFDWLRNSGTTPSSSTGPNGDYTSGSGYYLFIESSSPAQPGWKAQLASSLMNGGQTRCMEFAWNMYGISTGSLNVSVKNELTGITKNVFTKSGDQLQDWHSSKFDIYAPNNYRVIIEAIRGSSFQGDIAIDDIMIKDGSCFTTPAPPQPYFPVVIPVGCYRSNGYIDGKRIFTETKNFRNFIDWKNLTMTSQEIVKMCSAVARDRGYEYFGIEYWGECWTGPTDQINYGRDGEDEDCWPMKSLAKGPYLVGKDFTAMVYKWF